MKTMMRVACAIFLVHQMALRAWAGAAQYTFVELDSTGFAAAYGNRISDGQAVGYGNTFSHQQHAILWLGANGSAIDLTPPGYTYSMANCVSHGKQAGAGNSPAGYHALLWSGAASNVVDLNPVGYNDTEVNAMDGDHEGGDGISIRGMAVHALLWSGSASNVVDLHPNGFWWTYVYGISGNQQVGSGGASNAFGLDHALLWTGSAKSVVDLNPAGFDVSQATSVSKGQQAGLGQTTSGEMHALLWFGTAKSVVDLNPPGFGNSACWGNSGNRQVGVGHGPATQGKAHALLWRGTPDSVVDLHQFLSSRYSESVAGAVDSSGRIIGHAYDILTGQPRPIMWIPACEPVTIQSAVAIPATLWPPDRKMQPVTISVTTSESCFEAHPRIVSVTSDELANAPNKKRGEADWEITGDLTVNLRAERSTPRGRTYTISVESTDDAGNISTADVLVTVPGVGRSVRRNGHQE